MSTFAQRTAADASFRWLVDQFIATFLKGKLYCQFLGVEGTLGGLHEHVRYKRDITTEFVRYSPDALLFWDGRIERPSWLIEFKTANVGIRKDNSWMMQEMRQKVPNLRKEEIVNIEDGSYRNLVRLRQMGAQVVIWASAPFHPTSRWLAILPDLELNLLPVQRDQMQRTGGSGTPLANIFARVDNQRVFELPAWAAGEFDLDREAVRGFFKRSEAGFDRIAAGGTPGP